MTEEQIYMITVLRQKGWPIRPAYSHTVEVRPHPSVTFEGQCLALESDFPAEVWHEILRRGNVLRVEPYMEPEKAAPAGAIIADAEKVRRQIDRGSAAEPLPVTHEPAPPPPFRRISEPISMPEMTPEASRRELASMVGAPKPAGKDAITGQTSDGTQGEPAPQVEPKKPVGKKK
jgi:hypothetical protein